MATRIAMLRGTGGKLSTILGFNSCIHSLPQSPPLAGTIDLRVSSSPQPVLPEFSSPSFSFGGSMDLMAVPKKKVSPHKRGIRNGPKTLKPIPVLVLCKCCGRVRLPHYYCCGGKPKVDEQQEVFELQMEELHAKQEEITKRDNDIKLLEAITQTLGGKESISTSV